MKWNKNTKKLAIILAAVIVLILFVVVVAGKISKKNEQEKEIASLSQTYKDISEENSRIEETIAKGEDESYIEKVARDEYGYVDPEERIYYDSNNQ